MAAAEHDSQKHHKSERRNRLSESLAALPLELQYGILTKNDNGSPHRVNTSMFLGGFAP